LTATSIRAVVSTVGEGGGSEQPADTLVIAKAVARFDDKPLPNTIVTAVTRGVAQVELSPGIWTFVATARGFWGMEKEVTVQSEQVVSLRLWKASTVTGRLSQGHPDSMEVRFRPSDGTPIRGAPPSATSPCALEGERFRCNVPLGLLDLELRPRECVTDYRWRVTIGPNDLTDLGTVKVMRGASLVGWVKTPAGTPAAEARVDLAAPDGARLQEGSKVPTALTDARGFFQVGPLSAGHYLVVVRQGGYSRAESPVVVAPNEETTLSSPLIIGTPSRLDIVLTPPLDPSGAQWSVDLIRYQADTAYPIGRGLSVSAEGKWSHEVVVPGTYLLGVLSASRGQWYAEKIELTEAEPREIPIAISTLKARGHLRAARKGVGGRIVLSNRELRVKVPFQLDENGDFAGYLPAAALEQKEHWVALVELDHPGITQVLPDVTLEADSSDGGVRVTLATSDLSLVGAVVDRKGEPWLQSALVTLASQERNESPLQLRVEPDDRGSFSLSGFASGRYSLWAEAEGLSSTHQTVTVGDDSPATPQTLVLLNNTITRGRVVTADGAGVPGALIIAFRATGLMDFVSPLHSDADGYFELRLPPGASDVAIRVQAPGFAYRMLRPRVVPGQDLELRLDQLGGRLVLLATEPLTTEPATQVLHDGCFDAPQGLRTWASTNGEYNTESNRLVVPQMAAGVYQVCRVAVRDGQRMMAGALPPSSCASGTLEAGGELMLAVPALPPGGDQASRGRNE
jgi:hypothetical protein